MEIKFNGDFTVKKTPQEVYDFLVDPKRFCPLLPDYRISHIRGTAAVKMSLVETQSPNRAVYEGKGEVPGGSASLRAGFDLQPSPGGETKVSWLGQSNVVGRIASLAGGMLEPLAKKNVQKLIDGLQKALG